MAQVRWTPQAADDLDSIAEFVRGTPRTSPGCLWRTFCKSSTNWLTSPNPAGLFLRSEREASARSFSATIASSIASAGRPSRYWRFTTVARLLDPKRLKSKRRGARTP